MHNILHFYNTNKKGLLFSVLLSLLYVLPIILANIYYIDDMGRIMHGYSWTTADGRIITSFIMRLLSLSPYIVINLYPYYTIVSAIILGITGYLLCYLLGLEKTKSIKLTSLFLIINPFYLSNLVFKYDCLPMSLSICILVIPFFFVNRSSSLFILITLVCSYICFYLYQPSVTGLFVIGSFYMFQYCKQGKLKQVILFSSKLISATIGSFILWKISIYLLGIDLWGRGQLSFINPEFFLIIKNQWLKLMDLIKSLSISYLIATSLFLILFIFAFIRFLKKLDIKKAIVAIVILFFLIVSTFAINFVTENSPLPRTQTAYGFIFFIFASFFVELPKKFTKLYSLSFIFVIFYSFLLSSLFGQTLKNQEEYNQFIISQVSPHLLKKDNPQLHIIGNIGIAPRNKMMMQFYPILKKFTPIYNNIDFVALHDFDKFDLISKEFGKTFNNRDLVIKNLYNYPIIDSNKFYILRTKENIFIVDFDKNYK
ncbi:glucosyltransferase domain-containing protein [Dysgonomonas sp. Marseille-P4677]|uniref:glucosyltransferase domain-containing protein n=1 Tax=Dysgonomonas sp. Marseille-P4677 TaxID=2364790 RepID=UPI001914BD07|nr:glucosyltransferase domain-containing protein [Dysgonomonas sp. Marseille-P4677]MBK5721351.1 glucosyltransferase domain-containing protein [Dysgonomonas sp. Marseille-P4677]